MCRGRWIRFFPYTKILSVGCGAPGLMQLKSVNSYRNRGSGHSSAITPRTISSSTCGEVSTRAFKMNSIRLTSSAASSPPRRSHDTGVPLCVTLAL